MASKVEPFSKKALVFAAISSGISEVISFAFKGANSLARVFASLEPVEVFSCFAFEGSCSTTGQWLCVCVGYPEQDLVLIPIASEA